MLEITGQLVFREVGEPAPAPKSETHRLIIVVGVLAVPKKSSNFRGEHQVRVGGNEHNISIDHLDAKDISEEARGYTLGHLLLLPIWRC